MTPSELRSRRQAAGLTQLELARRAGVAQPNLSAYERGRRVPSPEVAARLDHALRPTIDELLRRHRAQIAELVVAHRASHPRVFGSVARGDAGVQSDLDILVDFGDDASLLDEVGLRQALTDLLRVDVDVVGSDALRGTMRDRVMKEAVPL